MSGAGRRLAAIYAHPGDDIYSIGGVIALHAPLGEVMVVYATSGEAGPIADPSLATRETLGRVREREAKDALAALGGEGAVTHFLRYPDGGLADVPPQELTHRVVDLLLDFAPDVVFTFGPDGVTKHEDHVAIHQAATEAFHEAHARSAGDAAARLLYSALRQNDVGRWQELLRESGLEAFDPDDPNQPRGVPDGSIAISVDCRQVLSRKLEALRAHRTQSEEFEQIPEDAHPLILGAEHFVQAFPPRQDGDPLLADVFDGSAG
jgi:LmbE family N-acetylglucosaminyl deacetylase